MKEGGSFPAESNNSALSVATEPIEAKLVARRLATAGGSATKVSPERKTIAVKEWPPSSQTFFHSTGEGVSAVIDEINMDRLFFFAVSTVCRKTAISLL